MRTPAWLGSPNARSNSESPSVAGRSCIATSIGSAARRRPGRAICLPRAGPVAFARWPRTGRPRSFMSCPGAGVTSSRSRARDGGGPDRSGVVGARDEGAGSDRPHRRRRDRGDDAGADAVRSRRRLPGRGGRARARERAAPWARRPRPELAATVKRLSRSGRPGRADASHVARRSRSGPPADRERDGDAAAPGDARRTAFRSRRCSTRSGRARRSSAGSMLAYPDAKIAIEYDSDEFHSGRDARRSVTAVAGTDSSRPGGCPSTSVRPTSAAAERSRAPRSPKPSATVGSAPPPDDFGVTYPRHTVGK